MLEDEEPAPSNSKPIQLLPLNEVALGYTCCQSPTSLLQHSLSKAKYQEVTGPKPELITAQKLIKLTYTCLRPKSIWSMYHLFKRLSYLGFYSGLMREFCFACPVDKVIAPFHEILLHTISCRILHTHSQVYFKV